MNLTMNSCKELNNGQKMPVLGLGVFRSKDGEETYNAVRWAWNTEIRNRNEEAAFAESLKKLGTDYVDLYLVHWPVREDDGYLRVWEKMEQFYKEGRARSIGVSNYHVHHIESLLKIANVVPAVDQVECHPELTQVELADYCASKGIAFEPWSPLGAGKLLSHPVLSEIAAAHGKTTAQVILRWGLQRGFICIPKSVHKERIQSNAQFFDFELSDDEMQRIFALNADARVGADPETFTF